MPHEQIILRMTTAALNLLKDERLFDKLYIELQDALTVAWDSQMQLAIKDCLSKLNQMAPGDFTEGDATSLLKTLELRVGADNLERVLKKPVIAVSEALYKAGHSEAKSDTGVSIRFGLPDTEAAKIAGDGNLYWVANSWNTSTKKIFQSALTDYFEQGMTRGDLADRFAEDFAGLTDKHRSYWELLADHTATKTREMGRVMGMDAAGVELGQIRARNDARTTLICRKLNGKLIRISGGVAQISTYLDAVSVRDMERAKNAWRMFNATDAENFDAGGNIIVNVGPPPYHFRCRSILVAYFGEETTQDQQTLQPPDLTVTDASLIRRKVIGLGDDAITVQTISDAELKARLQGVTDKAERQAIIDDVTEPISAKVTQGGRFIEIGIAGFKMRHRDVELILRRLRLYGYEPVVAVDPKNTDIIRVVKSQEE